MADYGWLEDDLQGQGLNLGQPSGSDPATGTETFTYTPDPSQPGSYYSIEITTAKDAQGHPVNAEITITRVDPNDPPPYPVRKIIVQYPPNAGPNDPPDFEEIVYVDKHGNPLQKFERQYQPDPNAPFRRRCKRVREYKWDPGRGMWDLVNDVTLALLKLSGNPGEELLALKGGFVIQGAEVAVGTWAEGDEVAPSADDA